MGFLNTARSWARRIKRDAMTLWFARTHPDTPWYAKALGAFVLAYALSPIDLIPDFIPVLGYLDDVILLPALIWLTLRLLPPQVLLESRQQAEAWMARPAAKPRSFVGAVVIVLVWTALAVALAFWIAAALRR
ncbi:YkvA family protein [Variovorax terrae]|uniref:YkvA family protein n=1 Tax=Variovorax terrae TaxID=2923278 RepID=A0A9X1VQV8_9BURK|nr:YkvA family protein [Variovorax terrae]MCJ0762146.1 YkvA family protein [Variovorax terrae]